MELLPAIEGMKRNLKKRTSSKIQKRQIESITHRKNESNNSIIFIINISIAALR